MKSWPFIFAASRTSDYQFVVCPDVFDAQISSTFPGSLELDDLSPERTRTAHISTKQTGDLLCVYRSGPIVIGGQEYLDAAGRKLIAAYGFATKDSTKSVDAIAGSIASNKSRFESYLLDFLNHTERWTPVASKPSIHGVEMETFGKRFARLLGWPTAFGAALFLLLCLSGILFLKNRALEAQLFALHARLSQLAEGRCDTPPREAAREAARKAEQAPPPGPPSAPAAPESADKEMETKGPIVFSK